MVAWPPSLFEAAVGDSPISIFMKNSVIAKATPKAIHPGFRFKNGRRVSTLRTDDFGSLRVCPSSRVSVTESAVAESKRPLTFRLPWGAPSSYNCTSVFVWRGTACTLDQSGMCLAAQDVRMGRKKRSTSPVAVVFLESPPVKVFMATLG